MIYTLCNRYKAIICAAVTLCAATVYAAAPALPNYAEHEQKICREAGHDFAAITEGIRIILGGRASTIIKALHPVQREAALEWASSINMELLQIVEKLQSTQALSINSLLSQCALVALHVETIYYAVQHKFPLESLRLPSATQAAERLATALELTEQQLNQKLAEARATAPAEQQQALQTEITAELVRIIALGNFLAALQEGHAKLADAFFEYGLSRSNQLARTIDKVGRKFIQQTVTPMSTLCFVLGGGSYALYKLLTKPVTVDDSRTKKLIAPIILAGAVHQTAMVFGSKIFDKIYRSYDWSWHQIKNQAIQWWQRARGLKVPDKTIDGFVMLKVADCGYEAEPLIGLESQFNRIMGSIQSALIRASHGEREPFKGVQRTFIFVGISGSGKTFLADQLKLRIAALREEMGVDLAYEHVGPEQLCTSDLKYRIAAAQEKGLALILWIDEMHLLKPVKDGAPGILWQFLQTEEVNKSNAPVWIFTATNEPGRFDMAITRAGRFEVINIYDLVRSEREKMFDYYLKQQGFVASRADLRYFAAQTHKATPAQIRKVIDSARLSGKALTRGTIVHEIMSNIYKIVPGFETLSREEQREVVVYQAGRGLMHILGILKQNEGRHLLMSGQRFTLITAAAVEQKMKELAGMVFDAVAVNANYTAPRRIFGHVFSYNGREDFIEIRNVDEKRRLIEELVAGSIAQELILGKGKVADEMRTEDFKKAYELARDIARAGSPFDMLSRKEQQRCLEETHAIVRAAQEAVQAELSSHRAVLEQMAHMMLRNKTQPHLTAFDVMTLLDKHNGVKKLPASSPEAGIAEEVPLTEGSQQPEDVVVATA